MQIITQLVTLPNILLALTGICAILLSVFAISFGRGARWTNNWEYFPTLMKTLLGLMGASTIAAIYIGVGPNAAYTTTKFIGFAILVGCGIGIGLRNLQDRRTLARIRVTTDDGGEA